MDHEHELARDPELRARLRAMDADIDPAALNRLQARVMSAATPLLKARARWQRSPSWLDVTGSIGRVAVPLSLAAAILAMVTVQRMPQRQSAQELTQTLAYNMVGDTLSASLLADQILLPESADVIMLGFADFEDRP